MKRREGAHFEPFFGCTQYPECRGTRAIGPNGEPMLTEREEEESRIAWLRS